MSVAHALLRATSALVPTLGGSSLARHVACALAQRQYLQPEKPHPLSPDCSRYRPQCGATPLGFGPSDRKIPAARTAHRFAPAPGWPGTPCSLSATSVAGSGGPVAAAGRVRG